MTEDKTNNMIKTRRCEAALNNDSKIEVPSTFKMMQEEGIFISHCSEDSECLNCYWANLDRLDDFILRFKNQ